MTWFRTSFLGFGLALLAGGYTYACELTPKQLAGAWRCAANCHFQEMQFALTENQRTFNSWLHQRPELVNASWSFNQCQLTIKHQGLTQQFRVIQADSKQLKLQSPHSSEVAIYQRL